uniref:Uncharacterized protein n=1 Tax=Heliothis virescens TaxID=7102 RepID=A0A2A4JSZ9_HELVI
MNTLCMTSALVTFECRGRMPLERALVQVKDDVMSREDWLMNVVIGNCYRDSIQSGSQLSTADAKPKEYKLREPSNIKYFDDENDTEDFSPDCSEYIPSPDRQLPDSRSTSSLVTDLQDSDIIKISSSTKHLQENDTSSLGGDSLVIEDNLHRIENITRSPSTVSNLSLMLGETAFVASPTVIYKTKSFYSPKKQYNTPSDNTQVLDVTLTPVNGRGQLPIHDADITLQSTSDDLEKTLTPTKPTSSHCNITNSELMQKEREITEIESENQNQLQSRKLSRKRKGDPSEWRDNKNKKLKNSGQAYEGARNKKTS